MQPYVWVFALLGCASAAVLDPDDYVIDLKLQCLPSKIKVIGRTKKPFVGHLYSLGYLDDPACTVQGKGQKTVRLNIPTSECGTTRRRSLNPPGYYMENVVHFKIHRVFHTKVDRLVRFRCFYAEAQEGPLGAPIRITGGGEPVNITSQFETPKCNYTLHQDSPEGPEIKVAVIGQTVFHKWTCDDTSNADLLKMKVFDCFVRNLDGNIVPLVNSEGCAIDRLLMENLGYSLKGMQASVETQVFKFSDSTNVKFTCDISICATVEPGCHITPPICPEPPSNVVKIPERKKRSIRSGSRVMGVETRFITVLDPQPLDEDDNRASTEMETLVHSLNSRLSSSPTRPAKTVQN